MNRISRPAIVFVILSLFAAFIIVRVAGIPTYTDAYYHFTAAERLTGGDGLTVPYLWTYIGAPDSLPADGAVASHTYWMPLTTLSAALGMALTNGSGDIYAAQWPFAFMLAGTAWIAYFLGGKFGQTRRHAWTAGILTLASPFYLRWWGTIDTFAPYALVGSLALLGIGMASERRSARWFAFAGAMSALSHLTRADGLLMLLVGIMAACWPLMREVPARKRFIWLMALVGAYLLVMLPWFIRNLSVTGSPLPIGGTQAIWFTEYDELFNYPAAATPQTLFLDGIGAFVESRWYGLINGLQTFIAVEGVIFIAPLMLIGLWRRRTDFTRGFWLYALGLHLAMTLVFPFPGARGGLFHSASALIPWWMALGTCGLDDVLAWAVQKRRRWRLQTAKQIFGTALVAFTVGLSILLATGAKPAPVSPLYAAVRDILPRNARVMSSDPAAVYYHAGLSGVVQPNEPPAAILTLAARYGVTHLLIEGRNVPAPLAGILDAPSDFLIPVPLPVEGGNLYEIRQ